MLYKGLIQIGVDAHLVHFNSSQEKEWYYNWFKPDFVVGIGNWAQTPQLVMDPLQNMMLPIPWFTIDGYIENYHEVLNNLPLILVTSNWVKEMYILDGVNGDKIEVLPEGCDTDLFYPFCKKDPKIAAVRNALGIKPDETMILTIGSNLASKGAQEMIQALALLDSSAPKWKYVCNERPAERNPLQTLVDLQLAIDLKIEKNVIFSNKQISSEYMPYLIGACDIYAAPSRREGFGILQVKAEACGKPVIGLKAMGMLDTLINDKTAFMANVASEYFEVKKNEPINAQDIKNLQKDSRIIDYRANVDDIAKYLMILLSDSEKRNAMGYAGRTQASQFFDYRIVAKKFIQIIEERILAREF